MTEQNTVMATLRLQKLITHASTTVSHQPRVNWRVYHLLAEASVLLWNVGLFVFLAAFGARPEYVLLGEQLL